MGGRALMGPWAWTWALALFLGLAGWPATAGAQTGPEGQCRQCHLSQPSRVLGQLAWQGPLEQGRLTPCPGLQAVQEELWATESLLSGLAAQLPGLARQGRYVEPWRLALHQARAGLALALAEPLEDGGQAARRLAQVRRLAHEGALVPLLEQNQLGHQRLWWGLLLLGGLLLGLAWLVGWRRGLPAEPGERVFARVKAGRLP